MTDGSAEMIRPVVELFRPDCTSFWATTFNLDLALFNEFLFRRLGDPPLNAVVFADQTCLDETLERSLDRLDLLDNVNRRWLLRGVRLGPGRFHPKSYLTINGRSVTLLVGSGNLSRRGIDTGREVFVTFRSGTPAGDAAIAIWRSWVRQLVGSVEDTRLAERFTDLETRLPTVSGPRLDDDLRRLYLESDFVLPRLGRDNTRAFRKKVGFIEGAESELDLRNYRALHFEKLQGDREGQYSIRLNDQWRMILRFETNDAGRLVVIVEIVDYH